MRVAVRFAGGGIRTVQHLAERGVRLVFEPSRCPRVLRSPETATGRPKYAEPNVRIHLPGTGHLLVHRHTGATRVSFDFRVVPRRHWRERYPMSHRKDGTPRFGENAYFVSL